MKTKQTAKETASDAPEAPTEHDCNVCGEHFSTCVCDDTKTAENCEAKSEAVPGIARERSYEIYDKGQHCRDMTFDECDEIKAQRDELLRGCEAAVAYLFDPRSEFKADRAEAERIILSAIKRTEKP